MGKSHQLLQFLDSIQAKLRSTQSQIKTKHESLKKLQQNCQFITNHEAYIQELTDSALQLADKLEILDEKLTEALLQKARIDFDSHKREKHLELEKEKARLQ